MSAGMHMPLSRRANTPTSQLNTTNPVLLDRDGDSEMLSSSSSDTSNPQTPTGNRTLDSLTTAAAAELSPPGSQGPAGQDTTMGGGDENVMTTSVSLDAASLSREQPNDKASYILRGEPGASWMNKKAEEEYKRAMESVIDQDFSLSEFSSFFLSYVDGI